MTKIHFFVSYKHKKVDTDDIKPKMYIFLHGYNETGKNMRCLEEKFKEISSKQSIFLYPNAPFKVENSNQFCWFKIVFDEIDYSINEEFIFESMQQSLPYLSNYIDQNLNKHKHFSYNDIILVGFSQGGVFSIHSSLMLKDKVSCAISFSGGFANPDNYILKNKINKPPILLTHGLNDKIMPYKYSLKGEKELKEAGIDVQCHLLQNTKHLITNEAISIAQDFIKNVNTLN